MPLYPPAGSVPTGVPYSTALFESPGGTLGDGPSPFYDFHVDAGNDLRLRLNMELGGVGAIAVETPTTPVTSGQRGWDMEYAAGDGAAGLAAIAGGRGADVYMNGGNAGDGTALAVAGVGGDTYVSAGAAGTDNGGGGANGGSSFMDAADGTGAGLAGDVNIATQTVGTFGTRRVNIGSGLATTVQTLVASTAPLADERLAIRQGADGLAMTVGHGFFKEFPIFGGPTSWLFGCGPNYGAAAEANFAGNQDSSGIFAPNGTAPGNIILCLDQGVFSQAWGIGMVTPGVADFAPTSDNVLDIGSVASAIKDIHVGTDVIMSEDSGHSVRVLDRTFAGPGFPLNLFAGSGLGAGAGAFGGSVGISAGNSDGFGNDGGGVNIAAGFAVGAANGGLVDIQAGEGLLSGGTAQLRAGDGADDAGGGPGTGGSLSLTAGDAGGDTGSGVAVNGGNATLAAGDATLGVVGSDADGGDVFIEAGESAGEFQGGSVGITAGVGGADTGTGGPVNIAGGTGGVDGDGGPVNVVGGNAGAGAGDNGGSVTINGGANNGGGLDGDILIGQTLARAVRIANATALLGLYGTLGVVQAANIPAPVGGVVIDVQARAAIAALLAVVDTATGVGLTA